MYIQLFEQNNKLDYYSGEVWEDGTPVTRTKTVSYNTFLLVDEKRFTTVQFTPSVENIFEDIWIEVKR